MNEEKAVQTYQTKFTINITELVEIEKKMAISNYGLYKNKQEFYGAIIEEYKEVLTEVEPLKYLIDKLLDEIRYKTPIEGTLNVIKRRSIQAIEELIQVVCCCDKYIDGLPVNNLQDLNQEANGE